MKTIIASLFLPFTVKSGSSRPPSPRQSHQNLPFSGRRHSNPSKSRDVSLFTTPSPSDDGDSHEKDGLPTTTPIGVGSTGALLTAGFDQASVDGGFTIESSAVRNEGLSSAVAASSVELVQLGTLGTSTDGLGSATRLLIDEQLARRRCKPVYVRDADLDAHYGRFCHTVLWPVFHYQIPEPGSKGDREDGWAGYVAVNQAIADAIVAEHSAGDVVWVHDYHLFLVPAMVRKAIPHVNIGFFLHVAFPSSEVFRCLAERTVLLEGVLGSSLVGFQTTEYVNHFLSTCGRLVKAETSRKSVRFRDRLIRVGCFPIGIDPVAVAATSVGKEAQEWAAEIASRFKGKRLIVSRDRLDPIRGVRQKLAAFECFLDQYPVWKEKAVLIQIAPSGGDEAGVDQISGLAARIDARFASLTYQPIVILRQDVPTAEFLALLAAADALLLTPLRAGMDLIPHEFAVCQAKNAGNKPAAAIVSEFAGCAGLFGKGVIKVNPWDKRQCADAISQALDMKQVEREERHEMMMKKVEELTAAEWTSRLTAALRESV